MPHYDSTTTLGRPLSILSQKIGVCLSKLWKPNSPHLPLPSQKYLDPSCRLPPSPQCFLAELLLRFIPLEFHFWCNSSLMQWISDAIIRVNCKTGIYENLICRFIPFQVLLYLFLNISCINLPGMKQKLCFVFFFNQQIETMHKKCEPSCSPKYNASWQIQKSRYTK